MKPPHHKHAALLRVIDTDDPAWNFKRWLAELDGLEEDDHDAHPMVMYRKGRTHFDLDAPGHVIEDGERVPRTPRDYLSGTNPKVFEARRLTPLELADVLDQPTHKGQYFTFQACCMRIEGVPGLVFENGRGRASEGQMRAAADAVGADAVMRIGQSIINASMGPSPSEGKRSGSLRGEKSPREMVSPGDGSPHGTVSGTA
jgi:hypothetical protein